VGGFLASSGFHQLQPTVAEPFPAKFNCRKSYSIFLIIKVNIMTISMTFILIKFPLLSGKQPVNLGKVLHDGYLRIPRNILKEHQFDRLLPDFKITEKKEISSGTIQIFLNHVKDSTAYNPLLSDFANPMTGVLNQAVVSISEQIAKTKNLTDGDVVDIINGKNIITATVSIIPEIPDHVWQMEAEFTEEYGCQVL
jgi:hypothetical protein